MWIMAPYGFFSIVCTEDGPAGLPSATHMYIRARRREHLVILKRAMPFKLGPIKTGTGTDYRYRITAPRELALRVVGEIADGIDYMNFKNEAHRVAPDDSVYHQFLTRVWGLGYDMTNAAKRLVAGRGGNASKKFRDQPYDYLEDHGMSGMF